jgi:hypothetical protein
LGFLCQGFLKVEKALEMFDLRAAGVMAAAAMAAMAAMAASAALLAD